MNVVRLQQQTTSPRSQSTYHILHVGSRRVDLASELVVKVQDELSVTVSNSPLPPLLGLPPVPVFIQILVQDLLPAGGVGKHHHGGGRVEEQEQQGHAPQPAQGYTPHLWKCPVMVVDVDPLKFKWDGSV